MQPRVFFKVAQGQNTYFVGHNDLLLIRDTPPSVDVVYPYTRFGFPVYIYRYYSIRRYGPGKVSEGRTYGHSARL